MMSTTFRCNLLTRFIFPLNQEEGVDASDFHPEFKAKNMTVCDRTATKPGEYRPVQAGFRPASKLWMVFPIPDPTPGMLSRPFSPMAR